MAVRCRKRVFSGERNDIGGHQCGRNARDGMDGFCAIHYPPNEKAKRDALTEKWRNESKATQEMYARQELNSQGRSEAVTLLKVAIARHGVDSQWLHDARIAIDKADAR